MSDIVRYSTSSIPNPITEYRQSVNTPDYQVQANVLINPDLSAVQGQPMKYWKHVAGAVQLMTQAERDAVDAAASTSATTGIHTGAQAYFDGLNINGTFFRALVKLLVQQLNPLRTNPTTVFAALTRDQVIQAIKNEIAAGTSDS